MPSVDTRIFGRMGTRTPKAISPAIHALCRDVSPDHEPRYVPVRPDAGAKIAECFHNVSDAVERLGGHVMYGWAVWEWPRVFVEAEHHAVWEVDGSLVDVTPHVPPDTRILFLPDPTRVYDQNQKRLLNVKRATSNSPVVKDWIRTTDRLHHYMEECTSDGVTSMDRRVAAQLHSEMRNSYGLVLVDLARVTGRNEQCFCQSGQKFKKCCSPLIQF